MLIYLSRYAAKYVAKTGQIETLLNDVIDTVQRKEDSQQIIRPSVQQVLSQLLLADCSHRIYMTKQELAYRVMDLPQVVNNYLTTRNTVFNICTLSTYFITLVGDCFSIVNSHELGKCY